ncbi:MAG: winged helix DNA-binding domain-containing protein [Microbacterium sp.]|uniref:DNA glycosylase AlkZ-like family protein n=1 Tax=Microbacterium sp. TaxID=51671 RepID=UPI001AD0B75B|nr:crosslink repair DNA glycosylase YcaQ family protein [Microbacterium sp.]MBN9178646.1 winged helix DNA-binding domain-containing protein [Microbacterium sp.]
MDVAELRTARLRAHRLTSPAASIAEAAAHMLAVQAQEFSGGRWALGARTTGAATLSDVDAAFDAGTLVRTWTQRGTIHIVPAADLAWVLRVTSDRQQRAVPARLRELGIDDELLARAERVARAALRGGARLTRAELFAVWDAAGIDPSAQRGVHVLRMLSLRSVLVHGPIVPRDDGAPTRQQYIVLANEWITSSVAPADPVAEFFARYVDGHGPATAEDFAWWSGLPLGAARRAAAAAGELCDDLVDLGEGLFQSRHLPAADPDTARLLALPSFEEYYLSYRDRASGMPAEVARAVGPGANGMVRPILVAAGEIVGVWTHSLAVGRHDGDPAPALLVPGAASDAEIAAALERYHHFITG